LLVKDSAPAPTPQSKAATVAVTQLQKATRYFRLYPAGHPFREGAVGDAIQRLRRYHGRFNDLHVDVRRDGLYQGEHLLLPDSGQSTDISSLLYIEGIFGLTITAAAEDQEVIDLLETLSAGYGGTDASNDLLTALWQRDFPGIGLTILDQLAPGRGSDDPDLQHLAGRIRSIMEGLTGLRPGDERVWEARAGDVAAEELLRSLDAASHVHPSADPAGAERFRRNPAGAKRAVLFAELSQPERMDLNGRATRVIEWASQHGLTAQVDAERLTEVRVSAALGALEQADLEGAAAQVEALVGGGPRLGPEPSARLGAIRSLRLVAQAHAATTPAVVELYPTLEHDDVRRVFRRHLSALAADHAATLEPLTVVDQPEIVKEAMGILAMGGKGTSAWEVLTRMAKDDLHPERAQLAQLVVGKLTGNAPTVQLLEIAKGDPDERRRLAALQQLAKRKNPADFDPLADLARAPELNERPEDEVLAVFHGLQAIGGARAYAVLKELARRKSILFKRKKDARVRALAARWLAGKGKT
jgi:hypothetical protein